MSLPRKPLPEDVVARNRTKALQQAAERTHAALLATQGTAGTPPLDEVLAAIEEALGFAEQEPETFGDYVHWHGFVLHLDRTASPWMTFTVLVPATPNLYWMEA